MTLVDHAGLTKLVVEDETLIQMLATEYPLLPIVIASGQAQERLNSLFEDMKSIAFVSKPYTANQLCAALRAVGIY